MYYMLKSLGRRLSIQQLLPSNPRVIRPATTAPLKSFEVWADLFLVFLIE